MFLSSLLLSIPFPFLPSNPLQKKKKVGSIRTLRPRKEKG